MNLGSNILSELSPKFFGVLAGPNARIYLDVVDVLEREMAVRGDFLERTEVLEVIDRVLISEPLVLEEIEHAEAEEGEAPAGKVLRRLLGAGWLEEEKRSDYRQVLCFEPAALTLIEALRSIVSQSIASFTGKLRLVCDRLAALRYGHSRMELIWEELKSCLGQVRAGLRELRNIRKQVERYAKRQLKTSTIAEALDIIYNEFSTLITQQCYRELIHARLPERLREAMEGLRELEQDDLALQHLREDFLRTADDPARAMPEILRTIEELSQGLGDVEPTADRVDRSTADFARRSRARIRYIQDVGSARRRQIKVFFDYVREYLGDLRLVDLDGRLELPTMRLVDGGLLGIASLAKRRERSSAAERQPVPPILSEDEREESLREMEKNVRNALRLDRANKFVERLELTPGQPITSDQLPVHTEDDILDVISCLVFAPAGGAKFRLQTWRERNPQAPVLMDSKGEFAIERFELETK